VLALLVAVGAAGAWLIGEWATQQPAAPWGDERHEQTAAGEEGGDSAAAAAPAVVAVREAPAQETEASPAAEATAQASTSAAARDAAAPSPLQQTTTLEVGSSPPGAVVRLAGKVLGKTPFSWKDAPLDRKLELVFTRPGFIAATHAVVPAPGGKIAVRLKKKADAATGARAGKQGESDELTDWE